MAITSAAPARPHLAAALPAEGKAMGGGIRVLRLMPLVAATCLCLLLSGCRVAGLRVVIPDYAKAKVLGMRVYRVEEGTERLINAGRVVFGTITTTSGGERIVCTHIAPDGTRYGPVDSVVHRPASYPGGIDVQLPFANPLPAGWFRVASYNTKGTSVPSAARVYAQGTG
jgi:hypothetical protein